MVLLGDVSVRINALTLVIELSPIFDRHFYTEGRPVARGDATGCNASNTNLDATTRNSQNIKNKHADQRAKNRATLYRISALLLLSRRGGNSSICKVFCTV
jgi:hypothetical protein